MTGNRVVGRKSFILIGSVRSVELDSLIDTANKNFTKLILKDRIRDLDDLLPASEGDLVKAVKYKTMIKVNSI